jgi:enoyl-CoA hydratase
VGPTLNCTRGGGIATLTLNRPDVRNALSQELRRSLRMQIAELDADESIGAIILTGADPAFCAGVDFGELGGAASEALEIGPLTAPFVSCRTPLIGAINGAAYTGGLELALACHFLVASDRATFADTHSRLGLMPGWGLTVLLSDAVGSRRARQMSVSCEPIDAMTALQWGLVNRVVAHSDLQAAALEIARRVCGNDATAVGRVSELYEDQAAVRNAAAWRLEARAWAGTHPTAADTKKA